MKFTFSKDYLDSLKESPNTVTEINPRDCSKNEFRELVAFIAVQASTQYQELKEEISTLRDENTNLKSSVDKVENENKALKISVNDVVEENFKLRTELDQLKVKDQARDESMTELTTRIRAVEVYKDVQLKSATEDKERILMLERHSRGHNLRFCLNGPEIENENTTQLINAELVKVGLTVHIENSHRVGRKDGDRPRQIIACFRERPERFQVLTKRSELFNKGVKVFEDLCREDFLLKKKHSEYMQRLHRQGKKVRFTRGCWYVNQQKFEGIENDDLYS